MSTGTLYGYQCKKSSGQDIFTDNAIIYTNNKEKEQ